MIELYELNLHKMTTSQEKAQYVSWFIETKSDVQTQRNYRSKYGRDLASRPLIRLWHKKFMETGTVFDTKRSGRPRTSEENIERVRQALAEVSVTFALCKHTILNSCVGLCALLNVVVPIVWQ